MMGTLKDNLNLIIAGAAVFGIVISGVNYFAKASDLNDVRIELAQTQQRLQQKIVSDQAFDVQRQMWALEEKNRLQGSDCSRWEDEHDRTRYRELKLQLEELRKERDAFIKPPTGTKIREVK